MNNHTIQEKLYPHGKGKGLSTMRPGLHKLSWIWLVVLVVFSIAMTACGGPESSCDGKQGCACDDKKACQTGMVCRDGKCQSSDQEPGQKPDSGTGEEPSQEMAPEIVQDAGDSVETEPDTYRCEQGTLACRCLASGKCKNGLRCDNNLCQICPEGTSGCACRSGNTCESGLRCESGSCMGCVGKAFCPCFGNNSCESGNFCELASTGSTTCKPCKDRTNKEGCNCDADSECGSNLLCVNHRCLDPSVMQKVPKNPKCYTPCEGDEKQRDGTIRSCHPKHSLMEGCQITQNCVEGSCVAATLSNTNNLDSSQYPFCFKDNDCPSWQTCLGGRCYSNCASDTDCLDGFTCHSYVCRRRCTLQQSTCDKGKSTTQCQVCSAEQVCQSIGSTENEGLCLPLAVRQISHQEPPRTQTQNVFVLGARELEFSNLSSANVVGITNQSGFTMKLEIVRVEDTTGSNSKPLSWLKFDLCKTYNADRTQCQSYANAPTQQEPYSLEIPPNSNVILRVQDADKGPSTAGRYQGTLRLRSSETEQLLSIRYRKEGTGRWKGKIYSFGNFEDENIDNLKTTTNVRDLPNAFLRRWLNFKSNTIDFDKMKAILQSIQSETWRLSKVQSDCSKLYSQQASTDVLCYPYSSANGYEILSISSKEAPVPTGVSSLDFTMDVKEDNNNQWQGRIVTSETLQYPGNPQITMQFTESPGSKDRTFLSALSAVIDMGGRYYVGKSESCTATLSQNFPQSVIPWLLLDFVGISEATSGLLRERYECQQKNTPSQIPSGASKETIAKIESSNQSLSGANPIPNGRALRRKIELVDGLLYQNNVLFAIIRERLVSPFAGTGNANSLIEKDWVRYGYILLERSSYELQPDDTKGNAPKTCQTNADCSTGENCYNSICSIPDQLKQVTCSPDMLRTALNVNVSKISDLDSWTQNRLDDLVFTLIFGQTKTNLTNLAGISGKPDSNTGLTTYSYTNTKSNKEHFIHYLCMDTKQFNGGLTTDATDCPTGSRVIFFELQGVDEKTMRQDACQTTQTCDQRYEQLKSSAGFRTDVPFRCANANNAFCDGSNRKDLRGDKVFIPADTTSGYVSPYMPLRDAVNRAFLYRTKFQSRSGGKIGFAPVLCSATAPSTTPYCYDAPAIEKVEERINCLEYLYSNSTLSARMSNEARGYLRASLVDAFGYKNSKSLSGAILSDVGFETLNAELRVMLGDEAYVKALGSRYDLAATRLFSFEGSKLEPNGVNLSGVLGSEMYYLYLSVQYYQTVLDRFYAQTPAFSVSLASSTTSFLSTASVTSYVQKLLLAASRKSRSWSQIARKYHGLNRQDLAKHVLERAYVSSYLEQIVLTNLLHGLMRVTDKSQLDQLRKSIEIITLTYNAALLDMQETYEKVSREMDLFGFAPGYIPFPAIDSFSSGRVNAFDVTLQFVKDKLTTAMEKETAAIQSSRAFDTSSAEFQSELVQIENNYNEQLIDLCGAIQDGNRQVPAIPRNAALLPSTLKVADPCGKVKGSQIYDAYLQLEQAGLAASQLDAQRKALFDKIESEKLRIQQTCNNAFDLSDITWTYLDKKKDLKFTKSATDIIIQAAIRAGMGAISLALGWKCEELFGGAVGGSCQFAALSNSLKIGILLAKEATSTYLSLLKREKEKELMSLSADFAQFQVRTPCNICDPDEPDKCTEGTARIASQHYIAQLTLETEMFQFRGLQAEYNIRIIAAQIESLKQQAQRLMQEQSDALSMLNEVQAASNDPNQRIYKNDEVISAERTFTDALREAYRLTLVYEYYTSTTYARKSDLFLVRMISSGDVNLENYVSQLERAYRDFEESAGKPQLRVAVVSMKDHIMKIPRMDKDSKPYTPEERARLFKEALQNRENFDPDGYLRFAFNLAVDSQSDFVSPVTYNHKIAYIEAEVQGTEVGDDGVGRIYLRQKGTSIVRNADNTFTYYTLPQRTAVINTYFNGTKRFSSEVYQNYRLQDRPLGNTQWELLFNQATEKANQDINLLSISDIILYVYYRDFSKN